MKSSPFTRCRGLCVVMKISDQLMVNEFSPSSVFGALGRWQTSQHLDYSELSRAVQYGVRFSDNGMFDASATTGFSPAVV